MFSEKWEEWLIAHPLVGVMLTALLGGLVRHFRAMAQKMPNPPTWASYRGFVLTCVSALIGRMTSALLGGFCVVFFWKGMAWKWEYGILAGAIVGMFATEVFDWIFITGRAWLQKRFGVTQADIDAVPKGDDKP